MTLGTLFDAITWTESRWDQQRPVPIRLHRAHSTDGELGAPAFTHAFATSLDASPHSITSAARTVSCYHPLSVKNPRDCPECYGIGLKETRTDHYRYPMTLALARLSNMLRPRRQMHPFRLVMSLAEHGWVWQDAARSLGLYPDMAEALFLRALRQLHSRYQEGPVTVSWLHKSESQQHAEMLAS